MTWRGRSPRTSGRTASRSASRNTSEPAATGGAQGAREHDAGRGAARGQGVQPARPRRRRLPDRQEVELRADGHGRAAAQIPGRQRRRDGAGHLQGSAADGGRSAPADRRHDRRRLRDRGGGRLHLPARGVHAGARRDCSARSPRPTQKDYLGKNILGSGYSFELHLHISAGRYMCGEETALLNALEGKRANPRVEAAVPAGQRPVGQADDRQQRRDALQRAPHRRTRRRMVQGLEPHRGRRHEALRRERQGEASRAVGAADGHHRSARSSKSTPAACATASGSAACCPAAPRPISSSRSISTCRWTSTRVQKAGSRMGTGTMIVLDDQTCPVGMVRNLEHFFAQESCGWCTPCCDGLPWVEQTAARRSRTGEGKPAIWSALARTRGCSGPGHTFCALAPGAVEPLQSALKYFREDFERHIREQRCPWRRDEAMATIYHRRKRAYEVDAGRTCCTPACRSGSICRISAGIRRWARSARAANARSSSSATSTTRTASS